ncbi:cytochrome c3 family protein [Nitrosococcus watsonii]|uniref:Chaperone protein HtpG n=1 Tax=Nitrosococcus watsoni (strain C-113) TaxID=105559 RepID=D8K582_NITWC|nr:cytochrome c3 family protein [Nitrosococcus watsonii]ADJ28059.1 chaperone protein HtpG [Nitrosococcus watsonii C-113]
MAQIFTSRFVLLLKLAILGIVLFILSAAVLWRIATSPLAAVGAAIEQPVPFSHKHHVSDDGIDCRYCHTAVEKSSFAGIPSTEICMTCHSQLFTDAEVLAPVRASFRKKEPLRWKRINDLPDFVYFNHSIHIHKGIGCVSCHGPVDEMPLTWRAKPLTMQWCLDCHRAPERFVRPRAHVFDMDWQPKEDQLALGKRLVEKYNIQSKTDCSTCHR